MNPKQVFNFFKGDWKLTRFATTGSAQEIIMNAHGFSCFRVSLDNRHKLMYEESLEINVSHTPITGSQRYVYFYDEDSNSITKYFSDAANSNCHPREGWDQEKNISFFENKMLDSRRSSNDSTSNNDYCSDDCIFYQLHITKDEATGFHKCVDDSYSARYFFTNNSSFTLSYAVRGPDKDYTMTTHYLRL